MAFSLNLLTLAAYAGCIARISLKKDYLMIIANAGFENVEIVSEQSSVLGEMEAAIFSVSPVLLNLNNAVRYISLPIFLFGSCVLPVNVL